MVHLLPVDVDLDSHLVFDLDLADLDADRRLDPVHRIDPVVRYLEVFVAVCPSLGSHRICFHGYLLDLLP